MSMGGGGGGDPGAANRRREQQGIQLANQALADQRANAARLEHLAIQAANQAWERVKEEGEAYEIAQRQYGETYTSDVESALTQYEGGLDGILDYLNRAITDYEGRSENIATKSADEAWNWNQGKLDEFISFADTLSQAAFDARQNMIAQANPYQLAQQQQAGKNNLDMLSGRLPSDVLAAQQRASAQMAIQGGFGAGSAMGLANSARNLGLTSWDLMQAADTSSREWAKTIYDTQIAGLQVTPGSVYDNMGLKTDSVLTVNQQNNLGLLSAQQDVGNKLFTGLNNALSTRTTAYRDIFAGMSDMRGRVYSGVTSGAVDVGRMKGATYAQSSELMGRAISDWGSSRQTINNTGWQNELQIIADRNRNNANMITGITSAIGGIAGAALGTFVAPGVGTALGASLGSSLGGAVGGSTIRNAGGGQYAGSVSPVVNSSWSNASSNLGNVWNTVTGLAGFPSVSGGYATQAAMQNATVSGTTGSWLPSLGGWVPRATAA